MNTNQILALYDQEQRREVEYFNMRREVTPSVIRHIPAPGAGGEGVVIYSRLNAANLADIIREQITYFEGIGQDFEWKVYNYDTPSDLKAQLVARGFEAGEAEAVLALDLQEAPPALLTPVTHDVRRITHPDKINDILAVQEEVWQEDLTWLARRLAEGLRHAPEHLSLYAAYVEGVPVSSAWIEFYKHSQFAALWGGSTLPDYRKRGLYLALLAARTQEAYHRGVRFLTVDASPMSRPILEKFGFQLLTYAHPCKWHIKPSPKDKE
jgi:GNAT superfamily N-acetyltransferase